MNKENNKSNRTWIFLIIFLVVFDQLIKIYIHNNHMDTVFSIIPKILTFSPLQNTNYSYIGTLFGNVFSNYGFNILSRILVGYVIVRSLFYIKKRSIKLGKMGRMAISFLLAGLVCSTVDVLLWKGSIDFIGLFDWFIFDTKDLYLTIFQVLVVISIFFYSEEWDEINFNDWGKYLIFKN